MSKGPMRVNWIGMKFGKLTVLGDCPDRVRKTGERSVQNLRVVRVKCDCGTEKEVLLATLKNGYATTCGCLRKGAEFLAWRAATSRKHGETAKGHLTTEYVILKGMKARCLNPRNPAYPSYGGRGITICARWLENIENFIADMGRRPSNLHTIDRIDNDGNYEPGNCRWATWQEQNNNRRPYTEWNSKKAREQQRGAAK